MDDNKLEENISSCYEVECKGKVVESSTLTESANVPSPAGTAKIPIVLAEFTVQIDVESKIKLAEPALEIKRIKKNIFLTECRLIPNAKKVFLKGYVRKNIEYATVDSVSKTAICGDIKHTTVHVPFQCITEVTDIKPLLIIPNPNTEETTYFDEKDMGTDMKEKDMQSEEYFNEKVYCELVKSIIYEADIIEECKKVEHHPVEHIFETFIEKEVIFLTLKLLQRQQINKIVPK